MYIIYDYILLCIGFYSCFNLKNFYLVLFFVQTENGGKKKGARFRLKLCIYVWRVEFLVNLKFIALMHLFSLWSFFFEWGVNLNYWGILEIYWIFFSIRDWKVLYSTYGLYEDLKGGKLSKGFGGAQNFQISLLSGIWTFSNHKLVNKSFCLQSSKSSLRFITLSSRNLTKQFRW